ncbi:Acyl-CoA synthetase (AMP-forming)/AMP-acid ligase II [Blastococcus aggregatus]|uniref:Acyl-CoA synthetase (AMP-forming)/AMP-acid ligase II n=1 Tax=Blastococcus aggregatus TaxID=38502 RepID=A0A285V8Q0_9ACTN|nr:AMP-binding protein [Blastococcus aggregatus]SOC50327.1 Acyl-CoA synthetase (AMP-forming)/AMP-acid ligase II [Blastococcus aggregatus]
MGEHVVAVGQSPFDTSGIEVGADGVRRYIAVGGTVVDMLRRTVERYPERPAVLELGGPSATFAELWDRALRVAGGLRDAGVRPGDRVAIRLGNGLDWALAFWGGHLAGAIVVPMNTRLAEPEVEYILGDSGAAYVVLPGVPLPDGEPGEVPQREHGDVAALFYTSGTTGRPKGAMLTHENFLSTVESVIRCRSLARGPEHVGLISVPLFHVTGCCSQFMTQMGLGGLSVVMPQFTPASFLAAIQEHRVTLVTAVPTIFELALRHPDFATTDVSSIRTLSYGGSPIAPELVHRLLDAFPHARVGNGFGLSETSAIATFLPHEYAVDHAESVGFPTPVNEVRLDAPDPVSGVGELLVRGPNVVAGYWGDPARTAETFVDGWLHTGDIAAITDGMVRIVDRAKDMINRGGENVYSVEVENALAAHPDVLEVAVVGVADPVMGEKVGAVVLPRPGAPEDFVPSLIAFARERLADYKVPQYVRVLDDALPRNAGGKVLKTTLRGSEGWTEIPRR